MLSTTPMRGFTIIELMVGLTLIGIILALGAPAMGRYMQNSKIASATQNYYTGIQAARTEAIRRNVRTEFVLTNSNLSMSNLTTSATATTTGPNWFVRAASGVTFQPDIIESKAGAEGEGSAGANAIQVAASGPAGFSGVIPFNGFGGTDGAGAYRIDITNPAADLCAPTGSMRCRRILVAPGGQITACDPTAAAGDSRAC